VSTADFYLGTGPTAEWLGSLLQDGTPAEMDDLDLFGPAEGETYTDDTFVRIVTDALREVAEAPTDEQLAFLASEGDSWPHSYRDSSGTDYVYACVKGAVHVFRQIRDEDGLTGQFLAAVHYPNGSRRSTEFPTLGAV
jgi:hypothetical protein